MEHFREIVKHNGWTDEDIRSRARKIVGSRCTSIDGSDLALLVEMDLEVQVDGYDDIKLPLVITNMPKKHGIVLGVWAMRRMGIQMLGGSKQEDLLKASDAADEAFIEKNGPTVVCRPQTAGQPPTQADYIDLDMSARNEQVLAVDNDIEVIMGGKHPAQYIGRGEKAIVQLRVKNRHLKEGQLILFNPNEDVQEPGGHLGAGLSAVDANGCFNMPYSNFMNCKKQFDRGTVVGRIELVDDICFIHSMHTDIPEHAGAMMMMNAGHLQPSRPSMGAWMVYGLGTENQDLPGFIAMSPRAQP